MNVHCDEETTLPKWDEVNLSQTIEESIKHKVAAVSNQKVTAAHFVLSEALQELVGKDAGSNFHSWAVWGSKKAGVTIRQEDLDHALKDATIVSGIVGFVAGMIVAGIITWLYINTSMFFVVLLVLIGGIIGAIAGALTGRAIARYSRVEASRLILEGNQTVLEDIGGVTASFVDEFKNGDFQTDKLNKFFKGFRNGKTSIGGQDLLKEAFKAYVNSAVTTDIHDKQQFCCYGNCLAILHEHIRLQPYIVKSLPFIIKRCVTQRMMTFDVGEVSLSVAEEFSALKKEYKVVELNDENKESLIELMKQEYPQAEISKQILFDGTKNYAADNWTSIEQRMRYVWELFERFHLEPQVRSKPF